MFKFFRISSFYKHFSFKFALIFSIGIIIGLEIAYLGSLSSIDLGPSSINSPQSVSSEFFNKIEFSANSTNVRIVCWIMTRPKNHRTKAKAVKLTWGRRCDKIVFISSAPDDMLGAVPLRGVKEGREILWTKTMGAFKLMYNKYLDEGDFFLKADDDTYVVMENLKAFLKDYDPSDPIYFGCKFKPYVKQGYMSGGAGYVLSKEALKRLIEKALPARKGCRQLVLNEAEDVVLGRCLEEVGVITGDTRDPEGHYRFLPDNLKNHLYPRMDDGHLSKMVNFLSLGFVKLPQKIFNSEYIYYDRNAGPDCCSNSAISFHYVIPKEMHLYEFLIYHLKVANISS